VGAGALSTILVAALWGVAGTADAVVRLVMGQQWLPAIPLVQIISLWLPVSALMQIFPSIAIAMGQPRQALIQGLLNLGLTAAAIVLSVFSDIDGCAVALGVAAVLAVVDAAHRASTILHCSKLWFFRPLVVPVIAGSAMLVVLWFVRDFGVAPQDGLANLLTRVGAGALAFCGVFFAIGRGQAVAYLKIFFR